MEQIITWRKLKMKLNNCCWWANIWCFGDDRSFDLMWFESFLERRDGMLFLMIRQRYYISSSWTNIPHLLMSLWRPFQKPKCISWSLLESCIIQHKLPWDKHLLQFSVFPAFSVGNHMLHLYMYILFVDTDTISSI